MGEVIVWIVVLWVTILFLSLITYGFIEAIRDKRRTDKEGNNS